MNLYGRSLQCEHIHVTVLSTEILIQTISWSTLFKGCYIWSINCQNYQYNNIYITLLFFCSIRGIFLFFWKIINFRMVTVTPCYVGLPHITPSLIVYPHTLFLSSCPFYLWIVNCASPLVHWHNQSNQFSDIFFLLLVRSLFKQCVKQVKFK